MAMVALMISIMNSLLILALISDVIKLQDKTE